MKNYSWPLVVRMVAVLSAWIIFPVLFGLFFGQWLDKKYDTEPWLFLITTGVAFVVSMIGLIISAQKELKKIEGKDKDIEKKVPENILKNQNNVLENKDKQ